MGSLRGRMALLLLAFTLLVGMAAGSALWITESQARDALIVNLAGRQRMLLSQMRGDALQWATEGGDPAALRAGIDLFDRTLLVLLDGGPVVDFSGSPIDLPASTGPRIRDALQALQPEWHEHVVHLERLLGADGGTAAARVAWLPLAAHTDQLITQADEVVLGFVASSEAKLARLRAVLLAFTFGALGFLATGILLVRNSVVGPIRSLGRAAERIRAGDLETPVAASGPEEIRELGSMLESMRLQLLASTRDLERQVERRTDELAALYEVSRELTSDLEPEHVLRSITQKARQLLAAEVAYLCLQEEAGGTVELRAFSGPPHAVLRPGATPARASTLPVLGCAVETCGGVCAVIAPAYRASHLAARLQAGDRTIGALCVASTQPGRFSADDARMLTKLSASAAVALENARLYSQVERLAMLEERQRIAAEMHDGLAQTLSSLMMQAEDLTRQVGRRGSRSANEQMRRLQLGLADAGEAARQSIARLSQPVESDAPLQVRLRNLLGADRDGSGPAPALVPSDLPPLHLMGSQADQALAVVREAVQNARRHAAGLRIEVRLDRCGSDLCLTVEDDGVGFDAGREPSDGGRHFGLSIMRARAARLRGCLDLDSVPGRGTRVTLRWPAEAADAPAPLEAG